MPHISSGLSVNRTRTRILLPPAAKQKRSIEARDGNRHQLDRDQEPADDGLRRRRRQDEMQPQELGRLCRRCLPRREKESQDQKSHHAIQDVKIEAFRNDGCASDRSRGPIHLAAAMGAVAIDLRPLTPA